jgi:hypothetical protein
MTSPSKVAATIIAIAPTLKNFVMENHKLHTTSQDDIVDLQQLLVTL